MRLAVEITLYPLHEHYVPIIKEFIERLNQDDALFVHTSHTCTLIEGDYAHVMDVLNKEFKITFEAVGQAAFVCKFLNATNMSLRSE